MELVRTFHPIGHGAFYTECFYENYPQDKPKYAVVYDCGCFEAAKEGTNPQLYKHRIESVIDNVFPRDVVIDALFISHFHTDHINGVAHLRDRCDVKRIFIPVLTPDIVIEAYLYNALYNGGEGNDILSSFYNGEIKMVTEIQPYRNNTPPENIQWHDITEEWTEISSSLPAGDGFCLPNYSPAWYYIPYNNHIKEQQLTAELLFAPAVNNERVDLEILSEIVKNKIGECKATYEKVFTGKHNSYSMTLYSGNNCEKGCHINCHIDSAVNRNYCITNCLYMGDFDAKKPAKFDALQNYYRKQWDRIGLIQVPHHGSINNYNDNLYDRPCVAIISVGETDKYGHPDVGVLKSLQQKKCLSLLVTEIFKTEQRFMINLE